eukprot:jgi/Galph1/2794/GphlegSOOS_G1489.1
MSRVANPTKMNQTNPRSQLEETTGKAFSVTYADVVRQPQGLREENRISSGHKKRNAGHKSVTVSDQSIRKSDNTVWITNRIGHTRSEAPEERQNRTKLKLVRNPNPLDSRNPYIVRRGKEKLNKSKQKQSKLKRVILEARAAQKSLNKVEKTNVDVAESMNSESFSSQTHRTSFGDTKSVASPLRSDTTKKKVKFREYCDMCVTKEIDSMVSQLLKELLSFQQRVSQAQPAKAKMKRRLVIGLKETIQCLEVNKVKGVIIPPDIESCPLSGGLDEKLEKIRVLCEERGVPIIYALGVHKIPQVLGLSKRKRKVSAVAIYNCDGSYALFKQLVQVVKEERERWKEIQNRLNNTVISSEQDDHCSNLSNTQNDTQTTSIKYHLSPDAEPFTPSHLLKVDGT